MNHKVAQPEVCEVNVDGHVIHVYNDQQLQLVSPAYLSLDSDGRVAHHNKQHILQLSSLLELEGVLLDEHNELIVGWSGRMCHINQTGKGSYSFVAGVTTE